MSIRAENAAPHLQLIPPEALNNISAMQASPQQPQSVAEQHELAEANSAPLPTYNVAAFVETDVALRHACAAFQTANAEHPLNRTIVVRNIV